MTPLMQEDAGGIYAHRPLGLTGRWVMEELWQPGDHKVADKGVANTVLTIG